MSSGLQRLQGRYPENVASLGVGKNSTLSGRGLRDGQDGRQKMPVVRTPVTNTPSYEASPAKNARRISRVEGIDRMGCKVASAPSACPPKKRQRSACAGHGNALPPPALFIAVR